MILDGWGIGKHDKGDVIFKTPTPYLDYLTAVSAHSTLQTCGEDVGLPKGQMGNSEVGHLNIGAGRVVYQDLVKINKACESGDILKNQEIINAYSYAQKTGKKLHLMGLTSTGGVHSSLDHLFKLIEIGNFFPARIQYKRKDPESGDRDRPNYQVLFVYESPAVLQYHVFGHHWSGYTDDGLVRTTGLDAPRYADFVVWCDLDCAESDGGCCCLVF